MRPPASGDGGAARAENGDRNLQLIFQRESGQVHCLVRPRRLQRPPWHPARECSQRSPACADYLLSYPLLLIHVFRWMSLTPSTIPPESSLRPPRLHCPSPGSWWVATRVRSHTPADDTRGCRVRTQRYQACSRCLWPRPTPPQHQSPRILPCLRSLRRASTARAACRTPLRVATVPPRRCTAH